MTTTPAEALHNIPLPPKELRWGGPRYADDNHFVKSGQTNVRRLEKWCGLSADSRVLDIGCGSARLLYGMLASYGKIRQFAGVDVYRPMIDWASKNLASIGSHVSFHWINVQNDRYNPKGKARLKKGFLPVKPSFDVITLFSVFSHMTLADIAIYLPEIRRVLDQRGKVFLTAFVELGVPDEEENPKGYHREWSGSLHCSRLHRHRFEELVHAAGLQVDFFEYRHTNDGQSSYVLSRADGEEFQATVVESN